MNGFEPLRRRVIDYTVAGQWQEVYDGPIEECEEYRLKAENAKLRELVRESLMDYRQYAEKYGLPPYLSDVNEHLDARLRELGIEVDE